MTEVASKFQVTKNPALPASCISCRTTADGVREFVDFGLSLDFVGAVVFCTNCMREAGIAAGLSESRLVEDLEAVNNILRAKVALIEDERNQYRDTLSGLVDLGNLRSFINPQSEDDGSSDSKVRNPERDADEPSLFAVESDASGGSENLFGS